MKYLINEKICFDSLTGLLHLSGEERAAVQLSRPSTLLLAELVIHAGKTSSREELLVNVWEKNGLIPSSNNLSNHISFLRKTFRQLGLSDNVITTVPREGFRLEMATRCSASLQTTKKAADEVNQSTPERAEPPDNRNLSSARPLNTIVNINIMVILLLLAIGVITLNIHRQQPSTATRSFPPIGLCQLYELNAEIGINEDEKKNHLREFINRKKIDCINKKSTIYFDFFNFTSEGKNAQRSLFFAQCEGDGRQLRRDHCVSYLSVTLNKP